MLIVLIYMGFELEKEDENLNLSFQSNLPVIVIDSFGSDLEPNSVLKETEVNGRKMRLYTNSDRYDGKFKLYHENSYMAGNEKLKSDMETDIIINARGQSSLEYPKKQYTVRFVDENGYKNPQELLGMAEHDKWVLNGMYSDKSMMRNYLAYKMGRQVMEYSPDTKFVELYLKTSENMTEEEEYAGIYLLTEKIERDPNRVNIERNDKSFKDTSFIMSRDKIKVGDTIIQSDWNTLEESYTIVPKDTVKMRTVFTVDYPSVANLTDQDEKNIKKSIDDFEYALRSSNFKDKKEGYGKYIDVDSFVKFAMINEITKNIDGGEVSSYFYKDLGQKIKAGPVWDFDMSMGNTGVKDVDKATGFLMLDTIWYDRLFQDEFFVSRYKHLYKKYRNTIWSDENINLMIDEALLDLTQAVEANNKKWYPNDSMTDYIEEVEDLKNFLLSRLDWMDKNIHLIKRITENVLE